MFLRQGQDKLNTKLVALNKTHQPFWNLAFDLKKDNFKTQQLKNIHKCGKLFNTFISYHSLGNIYNK